MAKKRDSMHYFNSVMKHYRRRVKDGLSKEMARNEQCVKSLLEDHDFDAAKVIPGCMSSLANCYGMLGIMALVDATGDGWPDIDRAFYYRYWNVKFAIGARLRAIHQDVYAMKLWFEMPNIPSVLFYAYLHDLKEIQAEFWQLFQRVMSIPEATNEKYWDVLADGFYERFAYRWFRKYVFGKGMELPADLMERPLGPYQGILDFWGDAGSLAEPLRKICDYHCISTDNMDADDPREPAFASSPFSFVPVEILAIYKLRSELGLETPVIEHRLLALPTASREPRKINQIDDPLFPRLQKLYDEQCQYPWPLN